MLFVTDEIQIPLSEIEFTFARSSGPGGQNVNKVNSKAVLRWNLLQSPCLGQNVRDRLLARLGGDLNHAGELVISSDAFRDQLRNRDDCLEKLRRLLAEAAFVPKKRKKTRPSAGSRERAKQSKRIHSRKKRDRRFSRDGD